MRTIAVVAVALLTIAACASKNETTSAARPKSTATIAITSPRAGESVDHSNVVAKLELKGGRLTKLVTKNIKPNTGHIHLRLDGKTITILGSLEEKIPDVKPGQHILEAEFVAADHLPFDPRVLSTVTFTAT